MRLCEVIFENRPVDGLRLAAYRTGTDKQIKVREQNNVNDTFCDSACRVKYK